MTHARIYKPAKTSMQSGTAKTGQWAVEYERITPRTPDPLMGWVSSGDTLDQVRLKFDTLEEAKAYAEREGLSVTISGAHDKRIKPRNYGDNFKYRPPEED